MGEMITFASDGATAKGYFAVPAPDKARGRGVVVIQEWWGLVDHIKRIADRFATEGFHALAPDLYHGTTAGSPDDAGKLLMALNISQAGHDLKGAIERMRFVTGRPIATVGFCMGGALSLFAACSNPKDVAACVVFYGGHPKVEFDFDRLQAPVLGHWAEDDDSANANATRFEAELSRRGKTWEFHTYPGTRHAFFNDDRPEVYDRDAAVRSWERTIDFLTRQL
jgi:carboxymethylenebutenolidase